MCVAELKGHTKDVEAVAITLAHVAPSTAAAGGGAPTAAGPSSAGPPGRPLFLVASASKDGSLRVWEVPLDTLDGLAARAVAAEVATAAASVAAAADASTAGGGGFVPPPPLMRAVPSFYAGFGEGYDNATGGSGGGMTAGGAGLGGSGSSAHGDATPAPASSLLVCHTLPPVGGARVGDTHAPIPRRGVQKPQAGPWAYRTLAWADGSGPYAHASSTETAGAASPAAAGAGPSLLGPPPLFALESSQKGAAVVSRWELRPIPAPTRAAAAAPPPARGGEDTRPIIGVTSVCDSSPAGSSAAAEGAGTPGGGGASRRLQFGGASAAMDPEGFGFGGNGGSAPPTARSVGPAASPASAPPAHSAWGGEWCWACVDWSIAAKQPLSTMALVQPPPALAAAASGTSASVAGGGATVPPSGPWVGLEPGTLGVALGSSDGSLLMHVTAIGPLIRAATAAAAAAGSAVPAVMIPAYPPPPLQPAWARRELHGFPITSIVALPTRGLIATGAADAQVAFLPLRLRRDGWGVSGILRAAVLLLVVCPLVVVVAALSAAVLAPWSHVGSRAGNDLVSLADGLGGPFLASEARLSLNQWRAAVAGETGRSTSDLESESGAAGLDGADWLWAPLRVGSWLRPLETQRGPSSASLGDASSSGGMGSGGKDRPVPRRAEVAVIDAAVAARVPTSVVAVSGSGSASASASAPPTSSGTRGGAARAASGAAASATSPNESASASVPATPSLAHSTAVKTRLPVAVAVSASDSVPPQAGVGAPTVAGGVSHVAPANASAPVALADATAAVAPPLSASHVHGETTGNASLSINAEALISAQSPTLVDVASMASAAVAPDTAIDTSAAAAVPATREPTEPFAGDTVAVVSNASEPPATGESQSSSDASPSDAPSAVVQMVGDEAPTAPLSQGEASPGEASVPPVAAAEVGSPVFAMNGETAAHTSEDAAAVARVTETSTDSAAPVSSAVAEPLSAPSSTSMEADRTADASAGSVPPRDVAHAPSPTEPATEPLPMVRSEPMLDAEPAPVAASEPAVEASRSVEPAPAPAVEPEPALTGESAFVSEPEAAVASEPESEPELALVDDEGNPLPPLPPGLRYEVASDGSGLVFIVDSEGQPVDPDDVVGVGGATAPADGGVGIASSEGAAPVPLEGGLGSPATAGEAEAALAGHLDSHQPQQEEALVSRQPEATTVYDAAPEQADADSSAVPPGEAPIPTVGASAAVVAAGTELNVAPPSDPGTPVNDAGLPPLDPLAHIPPHLRQQHDGIVGDIHQAPQGTASPTEDGAAVHSGPATGDREPATTASTAGTATGDVVITLNEPIDDFGFGA